MFSACSLRSHGRQLMCFMCVCVGPVHQVTRRSLGYAYVNYMSVEHGTVLWGILAATPTPRRPLARSPPHPSRTHTPAPTLKVP
jgi:hypothetical protein